MSCNTPILRGVFDSTTLQSVAVNGDIDFSDTTIVDNCNTIAGNSITLRRAGTYIVHFNASVSATATGAIDIQMIRNGSAVPGAHAIETAGAAGDLVSVTFTALVTVVGCNATTLSFRSATAADIRVANVTIEKVN